MDSLGLGQFSRPSSPHEVRTRPIARSVTFKQVIMINVDATLLGCALRQLLRQLRGCPLSILFKALNPRNRRNAGLPTIARNFFSRLVVQWAIDDPPADRTRRVTQLCDDNAHAGRPRLKSDPLRVIGLSCVNAAI